MQLADILSIDRVVCDVDAARKDALLERLAELAAEAVSGLGAPAALDAITARERLGSTGLGRGVAIPHGRIPGRGRIVGVFARLRAPIEFDALDNRPVDLCFALLVPADANEDHLAVLARLAEMFSDASLLQRLRSAADAAAIHRLLVDWRAVPA